MKMREAYEKHKKKHGEKAMKYWAFWQRYYKHWRDIDKMINTPAWSWWWARYSKKYKQKEKIYENHKKILINNNVSKDVFMKRRNCWRLLDEIINTKKYKKRKNKSAG